MKELLITESVIDDDAKSAAVNNKMLTLLGMQFSFVSVCGVM